MLLAQCETLLCLFFERFLTFCRHLVSAGTGFADRHVLDFSRLNLAYKLTAFHSVENKNDRK
jgi:hypothetical protein